VTKKLTGGKEKIATMTATAITADGSSLMCCSPSKDLLLSLIKKIVVFP